MSIAKMPDVSIAIGEQYSNIIDGITIDDADGIWMINEAIDGARTFKIQVCATEKGATSASDWKDMIDPLTGAEAAVPGSGDAKLIQLLTLSFRIAADAAVASVSTWGLRKLWSGA